MSRDFWKIRKELRQMPQVQVDALKKEKSYCMVGGKICEHLVGYKGYKFCVMEVKGKGCE